MYIYVVREPKTSFIWSAIILREEIDQNAFMVQRNLTCSSKSAWNTFGARKFFDKIGIALKNDFVFLFFQEISKRSQRE